MTLRVRFRSWRADDVSLCVFSLTERAQLLKNVFKKSTVSLYRSDSMQHNLLRKLHNLSFLVVLFIHT